MTAPRLELRLANKGEWLTLFDPRDWTVFVPRAEAIENGTELRLDLDIDGWLATVHGTVVARREDPPGVVIALDGNERDKINYVYGYVRGGLLNHREKRRLPIKLSVTYGAVEGPAKTFTRDFSEEGLFLFTDRPLPETSQIHMLVTIPGRAQPLSVMGKVSHTILGGDEAPPGMGVIFEVDDAQRADLVAVVTELEQKRAAGEL
ncbi:MAG TPA: PilZ domain-containing protein [Kofleriaceae bacterium]